MYGVFKGFRESQERYRDIQTAKGKKKQDDEMFDIKKKTLNLELEAKTRAGEMEEIIADQYRSQFKADEKIYKAQSEKKDMMLNQASAKERERGEAIQRTGKQIMGSIMKQKYETGYTSKKGFYHEPVDDEEDNKIQPYQKALGELQSGGTRTGIMGEMDDFEDRKEAEKHASNKLGYNWKKRFPQAVEILDKAWGKSKYSLGEVKEVTGKGKWKYLGKDKWEQVR